MICCGKKIHDAREWSEHRREHMLQQLHATPEGRLYIRLMGPPTGPLKWDPDPTTES